MESNKYCDHKISDQSMLEDYDDVDLVKKAERRGALEKTHVVKAIEK